MAETKPALIDTLEQIAKEHCGVDTLTTQNSDSADFHDIAVWSLRKALAAAFEAGKASAE